MPKGSGGKLFQKDRLDVTEIDSTTGKTYSYIMQKKMSVEKKRKDRIKISENPFHHKGNENTGGIKQPKSTFLAI